MIGICESCAVGWFYGTERQTARVGEKAIAVYRIGFFSSLLIALLVGFLIDEDYDYIGIIVGFVCLGISFFVACGMIPNEMSELLTFREKLWFVAGWEGTEELRDFINVTFHFPFVLCFVLLFFYTCHSQFS